MIASDPVPREIFTSPEMFARSSSPVGADVDGAGGALGLLVAPVLSAILTLAIALLLRSHAGRRRDALRMNLAAGRQCREHPKEEDDGSERC